MMRRNKFKKIMSVLMASAALATAGFTAIACKNGHDHNWEPDWDADGHWLVCKEDGEKKDEAPHTDADGDGICDWELCEASVSPSVDPTTGVYEITLNANGGTLGSVTKVNTAGGKLATLPAAPTAPANKTFKGWYTAATGGTKVETTTVFTENSTIYAQWNDSSVAPPADPETETATIHFHKPADFGDTVYAHAYYNNGTTDVNLTGDWMSYEVDTIDADGWYTISVDYPEGLLEDGSFNLMIINEDEDNISVTINAAEMWVNKNGNLFASKAEAVADEAAPKVEYTIYYYAPDWLADEDEDEDEIEDYTVYVYTYGGPSVGSYNTAMTEDGADGWYKLTFETTQEFTGFSIIFHDITEGFVKHEFAVTLTDTLVEGKAFYFIDNGNGVYGNKEEAEEAYSNPSDPIYVTLNLHKNSLWTADDVIAYVYGAAEVCGGWGDTKMTDDGDGWYHVDINMVNRPEGSNYNLIVADAADTSETLRFTYTINYAGEAFTVWFARDGHVCDDRDDVLEYEATLASIQMKPVVFHFQAPSDWTLIGDLILHSWSNAGFPDFTSWGATTLSAEGDGWYTATLSIREDAVGTSAGVILCDLADNDETTGKGRVTVTVNLNENIWVTSTGVVSYTAPIEA